MKRVEFWFEFASTYSYPAAMRAEALARTAGITLVYRSFLLGPIFQAQGMADSPFNLFPVKGQYMWRDVARLCAGLELPFQRPSEFPRNGLLAARIACSLQDEPICPAFVRAVYSANFAEDRDISRPDVLVELCTRLGLDAERSLENAGTPELKARLRAQTEEARELGIFGAPSFVVEGELFWGNDRLEAALEWARR